MTPIPPEPNHTWVVFTDGSSNSRGSGADIILENIYGLRVEVSLRFEFPTTNNQANYETVILRITLAEEMGAKGIKLPIDS